MLLTLKIIDASCPVTEFFVTIKASRTSKIISICIILLSLAISTLRKDETTHALILNLFPYNESHRAKESNATGL